MDQQKQINYQRIAEAIDYIKTNFKTQPSLDEVAEQVHLSSYHFQRLFSDWAGTTPKKFLQYISIEHAKRLLTDQQATLFDAAFEIGLSGTGRLHDLFINIEGMTPAEYRNGGKSLSINYSFAESPFGNLLVASTKKGICYMAFDDGEANTLHNLKQKFPNATLHQKSDLIQQNALFIFQNDWSKLPEIKLLYAPAIFNTSINSILSSLYLVFRLKVPLSNLAKISFLFFRLKSCLSNWLFAK